MPAEDFVTWAVYRDHLKDTQDGFDRLARVEENLERAMEDIAEDRKERRSMHKENVDEIKSLRDRQNILIGIAIALEFLVGIVAIFWK